MANLAQLLNCYSLLNAINKGNQAKSEEWMHTNNLALGNMKPIDLVIKGKVHTVLQAIEDSVKDEL